VNDVKPDVDQRRELPAHAPQFPLPAVGARRHTVSGDADDHRVPLSVKRWNASHFDRLERN